MPSVDLGAEVTLGQQASVRRNPAQAQRVALRLGLLNAPRAGQACWGQDRPSSYALVRSYLGAYRVRPDPAAPPHPRCGRSPVGSPATPPP